MSQEAIYPTKSREDRFFAPSQDLSDPKAKRRFWEHHLARCRQSGLTQKAYCQKHGLKLHQFYYWKKRLMQDHGKVSFLPLPLPG
ncbi:IS66 family insertion sequence element accessory protein TnpA, partial [Desulfatibacillum aliphaticivorans]